MNNLAELEVYDLSPTVFLARLHDALALYTIAMGYSSDVISYRAQPWRDDTRRSGWQSVGAFHGNELAGFAYAYTGSPGLPWHQHVARAAQALGQAGLPASRMLEDYVELTEIHVRPEMQGHGLGETLLRRLMLDRTEAHVLLSTPEVALEANRAWRLYRRLGFVDVIRHMRFPGDARPFAILGRALPLPQDDAPQEPIS
ncbi:MAG: GNAT family N-acetyltransferase [Segniliparus sp.]|uniref:GNAT family N-acetyltransferase n=1 Tax=Segniliparus sp. TaxID=2804064 RepID=UPI003F2EBA58